MSSGPGRELDRGEAAAAHHAGVPGDVVGIEVGDEQVHLTDPRRRQAGIDGGGIRSGVDEEGLLGSEPHEGRAPLPDVADEDLPVRRHPPVHHREESAGEQAEDEHRGADGGAGPEAEEDGESEPERGTGGQDDPQGTGGPRPHRGGQLCAHPGEPGDPPRAPRRRQCEQ